MRTVLIVVLAAVFGLSATIAVQRFASQGQGSEREVETVPIVVAKQDIPRFKTITAEMLKTSPWPKHLLPEDACTSIEKVVGRSAMMPLAKDEPIFDKRLHAKGVSPGMANNIPVGMRAYTIMTPNAASGVAGFILPGNKVDVLLTTTGGAESGATMTLLGGVEILAVHQRVEAPVEHKIDLKEVLSVTLLVTPGDAAKLDLGQAKGKLHLSLRNPLDTTEALTDVVDWKSLSGIKKAPVVETPAVEPAPAPVIKPVVFEPEEQEAVKRPHVLRVIEGEAVTVMEYDLAAPAGTTAVVKTPARKNRK